MVNDIATRVPESITSAELARIMGCSERWVATLKGTGRLPLLPDGRIDLHAIVRRGLQEYARDHRNRSAGVVNTMTMDERAEALMRTAANLTAHLVMTAMTESDADPGKAAARALKLAYETLDLPAGEEPLPDELEVVA